jgi:hypothetical protein
LGVGQIQSDGTFTVSTGTDVGLDAGEYRLTVVATGPIPEPTADNPEPLPELLIPARYGSLETSGLTRTITKGANQFEIQLERE